MVKKDSSFTFVYPVAGAALFCLFACTLMFDGVFFPRTVIIFAIVLLSAGSALFPLTELYSRSRAILFFCICLCFGVLSGTSANLGLQAGRRPLQTLAQSSKITSVTGTFLADPQPAGSGYYRFPFLITSCSYSDGSFFSAKGQCTLFVPASLVREALPGRTGVSGGPRVIFSAGLGSTLAGSFSPWRSPDGEVFFASSVLGGSSFWTNPVYLFRAGLRLALMRVLYDWKDSGGFLLALLSANRDYLSPSVSAEFRSAGLSHILALSGMHLSLIALVAIKSGKRIGGKRFALRLSLLAVVFFVWFAGASPSLDRALFMFVLFAGARLLGFSPPILPVLALSAFIQLLLHPADILSLAGMLSYGALWGILVFGEALSAVLNRWLPAFVQSGLSASVGAQLMTAPVLANTIGILVPAGIIASCIVSPLASVFLVSGILLAGIALLVPPFSTFCGMILDALYQGIALPVHLFALLPALSVKDLSQRITASIIPLVFGLLILFVSRLLLERRSPDVCFARL